MVTPEMVTIDLQNAALCDLQGSIKILTSDSVRQAEKCKGREVKLVAQGFTVGEE